MLQQRTLPRAIQNGPEEHARQVEEEKGRNFRKYSPKKTDEENPARSNRQIQCTFRSPLTHGGQVRADAREHPRAIERSESAGYFLLDLHHAQILLGLVVAEGHAEIVQEGEHRALMVLEPKQEVLGFGVFGAAAPP